MRFAFDNHVDQLFEKTNFVATAQAFHEHFGNDAWEQHAAPSLKVVVKVLENSFVVPNAVNIRAVQDRDDLHNLFALLVQAPTPDVLADEFEKCAKDGKLSVQQSVRGTNHNVARDNADTFIAAIGFGEVQLETLRTPIGEANDWVPWEVARTYFVHPMFGQRCDSAGSDGALEVVRPYVQDREGGA